MPARKKENVIGEKEKQELQQTVAEGQEISICICMVVEV